MPEFRVYPNGFVGRPNGLGIQGDPDPEVVVRYNDFLAAPFTQRNWETESEYLELALRVLGDVSWFLTKQLENQDLCRFRRQYVMDTIEFIQTGVRPASPYVLTSLFDYQSRSKTVNEPVLLPRGVEGLRAWVSQPNGFNDLVQSLMVFFGPKGPIPGV